MSSIDLIAASFKQAWHDGGKESFVPAAGVFYDRAQQPAGVAGFPYMELFISQTDNEIRTQQSYRADYALTSYDLRIDVWTCQNMTGGNTSGDQITDQGNIQRALDAILTKIVPDQAWYYVPNFVHCIKEPGALLAKDTDLYLGKDVYRSSQVYKILLLE